MPEPGSARPNGNRIRCPRRSRPRRRGLGVTSIRCPSRSRPRRRGGLTSTPHLAVNAPRAVPCTTLADFTAPNAVKSARGVQITRPVRSSPRMARSIAQARLPGRPVCSSRHGRSARSRTGCSRSTQGRTARTRRGAETWAELDSGGFGGSAVHFPSADTAQPDRRERRSGRQRKNARRRPRCGVRGGQTAVREGSAPRPRPRGSRPCPRARHRRGRTAGEAPSGRRAAGGR